MGNLMTFAEAVNDALKVAMHHDQKVLLYGLGVDDPKRIFGTTNELVETFGNDRVFDMPTSENAMTGVAIGAALQGYKSVMVHQRLDFFLLAMDQLVNNAAKWHYMFNGQDCVPITIRLILGRGWGQGPTHSQTLQSWFAHIPGLKVVMPTTPSDAKGLLLASIFDPNPVVFLEHRWLHNTKGEVEEGFYTKELGKSKLLSEGDSATIVSMSYLSIEALHAMDVLEKEGIHCDLIDLRSISPLDRDSIAKSIKKTGRLLVLDNAQSNCSVASEIISYVSTHFFNDLKCAPVKLAAPDYPLPTSFGLTESFYTRSFDIVNTVFGFFNLPPQSATPHSFPHDVPGDWFTGPF